MEASVSWPGQTFVRPKVYQFFVHADYVDHHNDGMSVERNGWLTV